MPEDWTAPPLDLYSRIAALEFMLEVLLANELSRWPENDSAAFKRDLLSRPAHLPPRSGPMDAELFQGLQAMLRADLEAFVAKAAAREATIRAQRSRAP